MPKKLTYAEAGVNRELRAKSKAALKLLGQTFRFSRYGEVVELPYGKIFPFHDKYLDLQVEGVGTKVLVAQLADKYDTIGIDGVALVVNDIIRSGARPIALVDNIHTQVSEPSFIKDLIEGIKEGAFESECMVPAGEIGDVAEIIKGVAKGKSFDLVVGCVGEVTKERMIRGDSLKAGDVVIGLRSSGIHSNGITLARKVLFKQWGGKYKPFTIPEGLDRELVHEVLEPMKIYVKPLMKAAEKIDVKGAVHITGDAYLKFNRFMEFSKGVGFEFNNFKPQPIFDLIQKTAAELKRPISNEEMLKTFNMGWGFGVITKKEDQDEAIGHFKKSGVEAEKMGTVTSSSRIVAQYKGKKIQLQ